MRWGSVLFDSFNRALYEHHGIQKIRSSWSFTFEKKSLFDKFLVSGHKEIVNGHKTNWYFEERYFWRTWFKQKMNQTFLPAALFVFPIKTSQDGFVMTEGLGELCLAGPMVTTGYAANDWGMRLPPTDRILGSDKVTRSIGKGSDIFPWSKKWFKSHRKSTGKGCCVAWRMCQFANLPRMTNTVKVTYVGWPLCCLFT